MNWIRRFFKKIKRNKPEPIGRIDWATYQEQAFKTNADLSTPKANNVHMIFGMITESAELIDVFKKNMAYGKDIDWKNVKEEVGDFFWYVAGYAHFNDVSLDGEMYELLSGTHQYYGSSGLTADDDILVALAYSLGSFSVDLLGEDKQRAQANLKIILHLLFLFCHMHEFDVQRIWANNIEKLRARYPKKFTKKSALVRNLGAEASILDE